MSTLAFAVLIVTFAAADTAPAPISSDVDAFSRHATAETSQTTKKTPLFFEVMAMPAMALASSFESSAGRAEFGIGIRARMRLETVFVGGFYSASQPNQRGRVPSCYTYQDQNLLDDHYYTYLSLNSCRVHIQRIGGEFGIHLFRSLAMSVVVANYFEQGYGKAIFHQKETQIKYYETEDGNWVDYRVPIYRDYPIRFRRREAGWHLSAGFMHYSQLSEHWRLGLESRFGREAAYLVKYSHNVQGATSTAARWYGQVGVAGIYDIPWQY